MLDVTPTAETDDGRCPAEADDRPRVVTAHAAAGRRAAAPLAAVKADRVVLPLHPYAAEGLNRKAAAAVHEATLLGVVVGDRLSAVGQHLVALADRPDVVDALGAATAGLLPEARSLLVLQSDLTAVVSGQPSAAAARLPRSAPYRRPGASRPPGASPPPASAPRSTRTGRRRN